MSTAGIDLRGAASFVRRFPRFIGDFRRYRAMCRAAGLPVPRVTDTYPALLDRGNDGGLAMGHYFHQDLWAARKIYEANPHSHMDIGSRVDGFIAHLLTFRSVTMVDIRPLGSRVSGLDFIRADATTLVGIPTKSVESLSSLHALEHFGLGRYGDALDPEGTLRALHSTARVLAEGGTLYLGIPIGRERTEFNAHRVLSPRTILSVFSDFEVLDFSAVDDSGTFVKDADPSDFDTANYACGLFELRRRS